MTINLNIVDVQPEDTNSRIQIKRQPPSQLISNLERKLAQPIEVTVENVK